jgi:hypothetical protein
VKGRHPGEIVAGGPGRHHGKPIATNAKNGKTYVGTGWVPASAFCA